MWLGGHVMDEDRGDYSIIDKVVRQRIEGIKLRNPNMIRNVIDVQLYSKFDDWPPGMRIQGEEALKSEEEALKVLDDYQYTIKDFSVHFRGEIAWASFYLQYNGKIRNRSFNLETRVSTILAKSEEQWRIVHEHFSTKPEIMPTQAMKPIEKDTIVGELKDKLDVEIVKILGDNIERTAFEIKQEVSKNLGKEIDIAEVSKKCQDLASKGIIEKSGRFYPKYKVKGKQ